MLCGQRQSSAPVFVGQSSAPVFGGQSSAPVFRDQNYYPSPSTYSAGDNDSGNGGNCAYRSDNDYQGFDCNSQ